MSRSKKDRKKKASRPPPRGLFFGHAGRGGASARGRHGGRASRLATGSRGLKPAAQRSLLDALYSKWPIVRFLGVLGLLIAAFYACYVPFTQTDLFRSYLAGLANASGGILRLLGHDVAVTGLLVSSPTFSFTIVQGCDGLEMAAFFGVAVLALPVSLRSRLLFASSGTVVLLVANVVRIVSMAYVDTHFPDWLDFVHWDVWPGILICMILSSWLIWARWALQRGDVRSDVSH